MTVSDESSKKFQKELNSGIVGLILLAIIEQSAEPLYGYQIVKNLEQYAENLPMMKQGALYPVLRSMETSGFLVSRVEPSVSGPPRKYYEITSSGRRELENWKKIWTDTSRIVNSVLSGGENASH